MNDTSQKDAAPQRFTAEEARLLVRASRTASLATLLSDGMPYASLVNVATDAHGRPVILVSKLAWHTRNLDRDGRASLLFVGEGEYGDALEGARVTVCGTFAPLSDEAIRRRYLARHPAAELYVGFQDFGFRRLEPDIVHAVAGFGRIETFRADEVFLADSDVAAVAAMEAGAVEHMNEDHAEAVGLYASVLLGAGAGAWRMGAVDPDGCDLTDGRRALRLPFGAPVREGGALRVRLVELAKLARAKIAETSETTRN